MKILPSSEYRQILKYSAYWSVISIIIGSMAGLAATLIFFAFDVANRARSLHHWLIFFLPFVGFGIGYLIKKYGSPIERGTHLLLDEIHQPRMFIPKRMTPIIFITSILTQLFGGSAGREAPAVQLSGALIDHFSHIFHISEDNRKICLIASIGAGFAGVFGLPLAGAIYGLEITALGMLRYSAIFPCFIAALIASKIPELFHVVHPHTYYVINEFPDISFKMLVGLVVAGLLFGFVARLFIAAIHFASDVFHKYFKYLPIRTMVGGIVIMLLTLLVGGQQYNGLGTYTIIDTFYTPIEWSAFFHKIVFTSVTLGSGFKGGEITPLFYIGTTLGNAFGTLLHLPISLFAGLGLVSLFSGASKAPLTSIILALELFGMNIATYAIITCVLAALFSGDCGLYRRKKLMD